MNSNHPIFKMKPKTPKKWAEAAVDRMKEKGTEGSLTRIAHEHGESPLTFARSHTHDSDPAIREKSLFAANLNKGR